MEERSLATGLLHILALGHPATCLSQVEDPEGGIGELEKGREESAK